MVRLLAARSSWAPLGTLGASKGAPWASPGVAHLKNTTKTHCFSMILQSPLCMPTGPFGLLNRSSRTPQGPPRDPPAIPREPPGIPQEPPGIPKDTPRAPRDTPGLPRDPPGTPQGSPGTPPASPRDPQASPGTPQVPPGHPPGLPGTPPGPPPGDTGLQKASRGIPKHSKMSHQGTRTVVQHQLLNAMRTRGRTVPLAHAVHGALLQQAT